MGDEKMKGQIKIHSSSYEAMRLCRDNKPLRASLYPSSTWQKSGIPTRGKELQQQSIVITSTNGKILITKVWVMNKKSQHFVHFHESNFPFQKKRTKNFKNVYNKKNGAKKANEAQRQQKVGSPCL